MFGAELVHAFEEVKDRFDPQHLFNPGKIVRAPKFDDRGNFRYGPDYRAEDMATALDWSAYPGAGGGFQGAVEMCNNNGACRALAGGVMCPSYRVTRDERDVTRGRANTLRLAITGQLGPDALTSDDMAETLKLCVSCKACRRECPTGVDMARMKIEVLRARAEKFGLSLHDRLVGYLPRYAPYAARLLVAAQSARHRSGRGETVGSGRRLQRAAAACRSGARIIFEETWMPGMKPGMTAGSRSRAVRRHVQSLFRARKHRRRARGAHGGRLSGPFRDAGDGGRPLCCGRTFLSVGKVDEARPEAERTLAALAPFVDAACR